MAGSVKPRDSTRADGTKVRKWRMRYPDPLRDGCQIERTYTSKAEADRNLDELRHSARSGAYINPNDGNRNFASVADEYRETWADLEPRTKAGYEHILKLHLLPQFGRAKISNVTADSVQRFINELSRPPHDRAPNTVRRIYGVLRGVLEIAVERRYITVNPCLTVKLPKLNRNPTAHPILTASEVTQLADAMPTSTARAATYVAATCGLRAGELWALRRRDVDLLKGEIHVRQALKEINGAPQLPADEQGQIFGRPKSKASLRKLSIPAHTRAILSEHLADPSKPLPGGTGPDALIFTSPDGLPMRHGNFYRRVFQPTLKAALPHKQNLRWHDLRHTCASLSLSVSPNLTTVMHRLGHSSIQVTVDTYGHLIPSVDAALADGLSALFEAAPPASNVSQLRPAQ
jgi:integrase